MKIFFIILLVLSNTNLLADDEIYDPWENVNRSIFSFNDGLDQYLAEPVARGYGKIFPKQVTKSVTNFYNNLVYPQYLVSDIIQFKFSQAFEHTARFVINSTFGVAGLFDVAAKCGLEHHDEDFALALAYHGVGPGPYLVIPFLGPSNLRDAIGDVADRFLNPVYWLRSIADMDDDDYLMVSIGSTALELINKRYNLLEAVDAAKDSSLDYYLFVQSSYYQHRESLLFDGNPPGKGEDDWDEDWDDWDEE